MGPKHIHTAGVVPRHGVEVQFLECTDSKRGVHQLNAENPLLASARVGLFMKTGLVGFSILPKSDKE